MHKPRGPNSLPPFRPIVSSTGTYNYELAKYLCYLLQPYIPTNYCTQDSFTFVNEIQDIPLSDNNNNNQSTLPNTDTEGTESSVRIREVSV